jgi:hypothetical protein
METTSVIDYLKIRMAVTFKNGSVPVSSDWSSIRRYPEGTPENGRVSTNAILLQPGTWYVFTLWI